VFQSRNAEIVESLPHHHVPGDDSAHGSNLEIEASKVSDAANLAARM
jgi:hypothetical protein